MWIYSILITLSMASATPAQTPNCVPASNEQLIIYRAGSLTRAFQELEKVFTCRTGIQVKDSPMGSVDAARQITAGGHPCDLYAPADYLDIDLFMKPAGYSDFNIVFAQGRMVLAYSAKGLAAKKLPPLADPGSPSPYLLALHNYSAAAVVHRGSIGATPAHSTTASGLLPAGTSVLRPAGPIWRRIGNLISGSTARL